MMLVMCSLCTSGISISCRRSVCSLGLGGHPCLFAARALDLGLFSYFSDCIECTLAALSLHFCPFPFACLLSVIKLIRKPLTANDIGRIAFRRPKCLTKCTLPPSTSMQAQAGILEPLLAICHTDSKPRVISAVVSALDGLAACPATARHMARLSAGHTLADVCLEHVYNEEILENAGHALWSLASVPEVCHVGLLRD